MHYKINPDVLFTDLEDGNSILHNLDTKFYFTLNETGTLLWRALMKYEPTTPEYVAERAWAEGHAGGYLPRLQDDARVMFQEMCEENLLEVVEVAKPEKPAFAKSQSKPTALRSETLYDVVFTAISNALCNSHVASIEYLAAWGYDELFATAARAVVEDFKDMEEETFDELEARINRRPKE